jgi:hypothetical protein
MLLFQIEELQRGVSEITEKVVSGVVEVLEQRALGVGTVTYDGLREMLQSVVEPVLRSVSGNHSETESKLEEESQESSRTYQTYMYDGAFFLVPQDFDFPKSTVLQIWQRWWFPDEINGLPPLKILTSRNIPKRLSKRLSDIRFLIRFLEEKANEVGIVLERPSLEQLNQAYVQLIGRDNFILSSMTKMERERRLGHLKWSTAVKEIRTRNKAVETVE